MAKSWLSVIFVAALIGVPLAGAAQVRLAHGKNAPADEYFGRFHLSILGVANILRDSDLKLLNDPSEAPRVATIVSLAEDAITDWEHQYPRDSWIPRDLLALVRVYRDMHTPLGDAGALRVIKLLDLHYADRDEDLKAHALEDACQTSPTDDLTGAACPSESPSPAP